LGSCLNLGQMVPKDRMPLLFTVSFLSYYEVCVSSGITQWQAWVLSSRGRARLMRIVDGQVLHLVSEGKENWVVHMFSTLDVDKM
jgi:hypothetical protein